MSKETKFWCRESVPARQGFGYYACVPGGPLTTKQANSLIDGLGLKPGKDTLFPGTAPQTWRMS